MDLVRSSLTRRTGLKIGLGSSAAAALALAGCAPGEVVDDSEDGGTAAPVQQETVDPAEWAGQTLNYVYFTDGPDEQATRDLIAEFEGMYDVTVTLEVLPYADLVTSVQARVSGGDAPDVVRLTSLTDFRDVLLDLRTYLGEDYLGEFLEGPASGVVGDNGEMLGAPSDLTLNGPFINLDQFAQAGVEPPAVDSPWTWDDMLAAARQVQEATGVPYAFAMDKSGHRVSTVLSQYGTALVQDGEATLDVAKAETALQPLIDLMAEDLMPRDFWLGAGSRYEGANEIFLAQEVPIYLSGNWQVGQFASNAQFEWAAAPNPTQENEGGFPGGKYMAAFADGPNPGLAAEFIKFMNEPESQTTFITAGGFLPTRKDLAEDGVEYPERQADMDVFLADLQRTPEFTYAANADPAFAGAATALVESISSVVAGEADLPTALEDLRTEVESLVEELHG